MRTNKRFVVAGAAVVVAATVLAGCGGQVGGSSSSGNTSAAAGGKKSDSKDLVLIPGKSAEPFYISMQCAAQTEAKKLDYNLTTQAPAAFDPALQTPIVTGVLNKKPAGVLIAPTSDTAMRNPMNQLKSAGINVIQVDTALKDSSIAQSSISSDNEAGGKKAAQTLIKLLGNKSGSVLVLDTIAGTSTTNARAKGFNDAIKADPKLKPLKVEFTNNDAAQATQKLNGVMAAHPDLVGVFATNLNTGQGAAASLGNAGKAGKIQLVGFDASPDEVNGLKDGKFQALIAQDPGFIGAEGVREAVAAAKGQPTKKTVAADLVPITAKDMNNNSKYFYKAKC